ncbi:DNA glycosylase [Cantharellus anzutake]|uniref:DNA glycosylase n=1 Tax=Cantharellus anzutake TaxID=1750568 RepID=UPI001905C060|nr:DNA glycosylase [Cantharellus anzutake]KAF8326618.1 DNA glycosylase [Cantharellus anzutake]
MWRACFLVLGHFEKSRPSFTIRMPTTRSSSRSVPSMRDNAAPTPRRKRKITEIPNDSNQSMSEEVAKPARTKRARSGNETHGAYKIGESSPETSKSPQKKPSSPRKRSGAKPVEDESVFPKPFVPKYFLDLDPNTTVIPARLSFDFEEAKAHLIAADVRFEEVFRKLKCRPFENPEPVNPFRTLVVSILGQQISWLAARSITHKFLRLYDSSLPEKPPAHGEKPHTFFPTPGEVATTDITILRSAGLSQRKAEYVIDLATHFVDGRLSAVRLAQADDEVMEQDLISVRGIGKWTVQMFAMFSLRRPDVLAVGDLGLQKGILRWVLSSYTGGSLTIQPTKLPKAPDDQDDPSPQSQSGDMSTTDDAQQSVVPDDAPALPPVSTGVAEPIPPPSPIKGRRPAEGEEGRKDVELPPGVTLDEVKRRLNGKKPNKNYYVSPEEFEFLTKDWAPYRSLGCYYLWALGEDT